MHGSSISTRSSGIPVCGNIRWGCYLMGEGSDDNSVVVCIDNSECIALARRGNVYEKGV
jgi:hypothetical protein